MSGAYERRFQRRSESEVDTEKCTFQQEKTTRNVKYAGYE